MACGAAGSELDTWLAMHTLPQSTEAGVPGAVPCRDLQGHWVAAPAMAAVVDRHVFARLFGELETGATLDIIKDRLAGMGQETEEEQERARQVLEAAMHEDESVFQEVLDAMCKEVILPSRQQATYALTIALEGGQGDDYVREVNGTGRKEIVMAVVERMAKETPYELMTEPMDALFQSHLFGDQEVVNAVLSVVPPATFEAKPEDVYDSDVLDLALSCPSDHVQRAVELVMRFVPSLEERLEGWRWFRYVRAAAQFGDVEVVEMIHKMMPLMADGSGRRGRESDYAYAVQGLIARCLSDSVTPILEFLVGEGGMGCLDACDPMVVLFMPTQEDVEWILERAPLMLQNACRESYSLDVLISYCVRPEYYVDLIEEMVEPEVIVEMMQQTGPAKQQRHGISWRCRLKVLHEKVPESMGDDVRWRWLMEAIEDKAYKDVEYMAGMCDRGHLTRRNEEGETAWEVAARDDTFPKQLLDRLRVMTKGAHA